MSTYNINFSDPLRAGFQIAPGGFNGPGGASVSSALRLYGRGALEWGEAVDENMLRTLENFNGATPPPFALAGQIWFQTKFYWFDSVGNDWYRMDPDTPGAWVDITATVAGGGTGGQATQPVQTIGAYWFTNGAPVAVLDAFGTLVKPFTLYLYEQYGPPGVAPGWLERANSEATVPPVSAASPPIFDPTADYPEQNLLVWDEFQGEWVSPPVAFVAPFASPPPDPSTGAFWWDTTNDQLNIWDGTAWTGIILASGAQPMIADLNFGGFKGVGLADPTNPQDAVTLNYANANYLRLNGTNTPTAALTMGGFSLMNLPVQVYPLGSSNDAASLAYVNGLAAAIGTPTAGSNGFATTFITAGPYTAPGAKQGDIAVDGTRAWIKITAGFILTGPTNFGVTDGSDANWKQLFPALYS